MTTQEPLVRFYDLSGPKPWSPACCPIRCALNYKGIPYTVTKVSYPGIKPLCEKLFPSMSEPGSKIEATVPIIEILPVNGQAYQALNDSTPIVRLLNEKFTPEGGFKHLEGVEEAAVYEVETMYLGRALWRWILYDVWENALDKEDGSREYYRRTREEFTKCPLEKVTEIEGGGEEAVLKDLSLQWEGLRERMKGDDGTTEPTYLDFYDAGQVRWVEGASKEKFERLMTLYGDDTFTKLLKKVEKYSA